MGCPSNRAVAMVNELSARLHQSPNHLRLPGSPRCCNMNYKEEVGCHQVTGQVRSLHFLVDFDYTDVTALCLRRSCPGCFLANADLVRGGSDAELQH